MSEQLNMVCFLGIGGIGMSAIARYYHANGVAVWGYDRTPSALTQQLEALGIPVTYTDSLESLPAALHPQASRQGVLVVYTPAIPKQGVLLNYFFNNGFRVIKRAFALAELTQNAFTVAVAGTHGKTTTSTLVAHICQVAGLEPTAILGGISGNYGSNLLLGKPNLCVVEADEFDRSFLSLHPAIAAITSTDPDHLDIYETKAQFLDAFEAFASQVTGTLFYKNGIEINLPQHIKTQSYGSTGDIVYKNVQITNAQYSFDYEGDGVEITDITCGLSGIHNVENATAAIAIALQMGIAIPHIKTAVASYQGVKRRFEYLHKSPELTYIDDYAHHPTEIKALVQSVKQLYPAHQIVGIFQPHLYSRTQDFEQGFAHELSQLHQLYLLDIYAARESPIENVTSQNLLLKVSLEKKKHVQKTDIAHIIADIKQQNQPTVLLTIGAGDIDQIVPEIVALINS